MSEIFSESHVLLLRKYLPGTETIRPLVIEGVGTMVLFH